MSLTITSQVVLGGKSMTTSEHLVFPCENLSYLELQTFEMMDESFAVKSETNMDLVVLQD